MPIYTYKILDTGELVEVLQGINDKELTEHEGKKVKKVPSVCNAQFKGLGFYKTDYKK